MKHTVHPKSPVFQRDQPNNAPFLNIRDAKKCMESPPPHQWLILLTLSRNKHTETRALMMNNRVTGFRALQMYLCYRVCVFTVFLPKWAIWMAFHSLTSSHKTHGLLCCCSDKLIRNSSVCVCVDLRVRVCVCASVCVWMCGGRSDVRSDIDLNIMEQDIVVGYETTCFKCILYSRTSLILWMFIIQQHSLRGNKTPSQFKLCSIWTCFMEMIIQLGLSEVFKYTL